VPKLLRHAKPLGARARIGTCYNWVVATTSAGASAGRTGRGEESRFVNLQEHRFLTVENVHSNLLTPLAGESTMHDEASQTGGFLDSLVAGIGGPDGGWNGCKERERPRRRILGRTCAASVALAISLLLPAAWGEESSEPLPTTSETSFFETKVRPILVEHCYECHSVKAGAAEGGLLVDSRVAIRQGGDSGPGVVPGDPEASLVLTAISHSDPDLKMPPKRSRLPGSVIADLTK